MRKITLTLLVIVCCATVFADQYSQERKPLKPNPISISLSLPKPVISQDISRPCWYGEKLDFKIKWGVLSVGSATMESSKIVDVDGISSYYIKTTAQSTSFVDTFFKVRDKNESLMSVDDLRSVGFSKEIREGAYLWDDWVTFDIKNKTFNGQQKDRDENITRVKGEIPGNVQDVLSSIYYVRAQELQVGKTITFDVNTKKNWPLIVKVLKREKIKVPAGEFDCFVVEPKMRDKGIFVQKGKSLKVWLTADEYHIPVLMKAEIFIGHVSAMLENYTRQGEKLKSVVTNATDTDKKIDSEYSSETQKAEEALKLKVQKQNEKDAKTKTKENN